MITETLCEFLVENKVTAKIDNYTNARTKSGYKLIDLVKKKDGGSLCAYISVHDGFIKFSTFRIPLSDPQSFEKLLEAIECS